MLSENLKRIREEKGFSKLRLEKVTGVARTTIRYIENGKVNNVKFGTLQKLAKALDVKVEDLIK